MLVDIALITGVAYCCCISVLFSPYNWFENVLRSEVSLVLAMAIMRSGLRSIAQSMHLHHQNRRYFGWIQRKTNGLLPIARAERWSQLTSVSRNNADTYLINNICNIFRIRIDNVLSFYSVNLCMFIRSNDREMQQWT